MPHRRLQTWWQASFVVALACGFALLAPAHALLLDDADKERVEVEWPDPAPAAPDLNKLVGFSPLEGVSRQRFAFDPASIVVVDNIGVRFTLVVTSPSGTPNISHEAFRCNTQERKMLATGHRDGRWSPLVKPEWAKLDARNNATPTLKPLYLAMCDGGKPRTDAADIQRRLDDMSRVQP